MAEKKESKKATKKAEPKLKKVVEAKVCMCRTEAGFRKNPHCAPGTGCLA